ncbi:MAG: energy transducer TonB [Flavobacteriales bacterium]|nr:energy transducer TonB [Flavobacteriales bacterium]
MKKAIFFFFVILLFTGTISAQEDTTDSIREEVFTMLEEMPIFPGCDSLIVWDEINQCTNQAIAIYVQHVLKIPEDLKKSGVHDKLYVRFIVSKTGEIKSAIVVKGPKSGNEQLKAAALKAVNLLPSMIPGKHRGAPVDVQYHVPVEFEYEEQEIFTIVEEMPIWPDCVGLKHKGEKHQCSIDKIFEFAETRAKNYKLSREEIGGTAFLRFIVDKDGSVTDVSVLKGIQNEPQLDSIAIGIIKSMPRMLPGTQRGEPVRVQYTLPVKFRR